MGRHVLPLLALLLIAGCTRTVDDARPLKARSVAPIAANQVEDLVSRAAHGGDAGSSLFNKVEPAECAGLAQEVHAPFVFGAKPVAHSGGIFYDDETATPGNVVEIVGVYYADFDPVAAVQNVRRTVEACSDDVVKAITLGGDGDDFTVRPRSDSGSPQIVLWALTDVADWVCDNAFVAAYNAAIEITTCGPTRGYDVVTQAQNALERIDRLANATA